MPEGQSFWSNFLARLLRRKPNMEELTRRVNRAVESLLENEALTADLDDAAAKVLLDWGGASVKAIGQGTADLKDAEAEGVMEPRMRAVRQLMRGVNRWVANRQEMTAEDGAASLAEMVEQANVIYGKAFTPPDDNRRDAFLKQLSELSADPSQMVAALRELLEGSRDTSATGQGGK